MLAVNRFARIIANVLDGWTNRGEDEAAEGRRQVAGGRKR